MRRGLIGLLAVGAVGAIAGASGILAVFEDSATTGAAGGADREEITTPARFREADIAIAEYDVDATVPRCGRFVDDLETGVFSGVASATPGGDGRITAVAGICVLNSGEQDLPVGSGLSVEVIEIEDVEGGCTGDEAVVDPAVTGCGTEGELSNSMYWEVEWVPCGTDPVPPVLDVVSPFTEGARQSTLLRISALARGSVVCLIAVVRYDPADTNAVVAEQSDILRWRFRFKASTALVR